VQRIAYLVAESAEGGAYRYISSELCPKRLFKSARLRTYKRQRAYTSRNSDDQAPEIFEPAKSFFRFGLFRVLRRRYLNLNGVNVVRLCGVHEDNSQTSVPIALLDGSRGLRSGSTWAHRLGG